MALLKHSELYAALTNNAELMAKVTGVYDMPPDNAASPYIEVGATTEANDELLDNSGAEVSATLHIWSNYHGRKEVLEVRDLIVAAIPSWALYDGIEVLRDSAEPDWWHGVVDIRYYDRRN